VERKLEDQEGEFDKRECQEKTLFPNPLLAQVEKLKGEVKAGSRVLPDFAAPVVFVQRRYLQAGAGEMAAA
jgi:hypothetical protein